MDDNTILKYTILNEQIVLSCLMQNQKVFKKFINKVNSDFFIHNKNKVILSVLKTIYNKKLDFNLTTFVEVGGNRNYGSLKQIEKLIDNYGDVAKNDSNIEYHINKLSLNYLKYQTYNESLNLLDSLLIDESSDKTDIVNVVDTIKHKFDSIEKSSNSVKSGKEIFKNYIEVLDKRLDGTFFGSTGIPEIDAQLTEGFIDGKITVLGASTSVGKTTFCVILTDAKIEMGQKVCYFALEPQVNSLLDMLVSRRLNIKRNELIKNLSEFEDEIVDDIEDEVYWLTNESELLHFVDNPLITFDVVEDILLSGNYKLAIVDLFEKFKEVPSGDTKAISDALDKLQTIAKNTNTHIIVVQQLGRGATNYRGKKRLKPVLSDLMNSSKYEQVADNVLFLYREKYYNPDLVEDILEIIVAKQREGPRDFSMYFKFIPEYCQIGDVLSSDDVEENLDFG